MKTLEEAISSVLSGSESTERIVEEGKQSKAQLQALLKQITKSANEIGKHQKLIMKNFEKAGYGFQELRGLNGAFEMVDDEMGGPWSDLEDTIDEME